MSLTPVARQYARGVTLLNSLIIVLIVLGVVLGLKVIEILG